MINRFSFNRRIIKNNSKIYSDYFEERGIRSLDQYSSPIIKYPTDEELNLIPFLEHTWVTGDRLYKLSQKYYGNTKDWWIILNFNKIGSEVSIKQGDIIKIPQNIQETLVYFI